VMITMAVENVGGEKLSLQDLYPPAGGNGTPVKGRWGVVGSTMWTSMISTYSDENSRCKSYTPQTSGHSRIR
jgi:hypothetical protein